MNPGCSPVAICNPHQFERFLHRVGFEPVTLAWSPNFFLTTPAVAWPSPRSGFVIDYATRLFTAIELLDWLYVYSSKSGLISIHDLTCCCCFSSIKLFTALPDSPQQLNPFFFRKQSHRGVLTIKSGNAATSAHLIVKEGVKQKRGTRNVRLSVLCQSVSQHVVCCLVVLI